MASQIKKMVQQYYEMWNDGDFEKATAIMQPDIHFHGSLGFNIDGIDAFKEYAGMIIRAFPDLYHATERIVAEEGRAAAYVLYTGLHKGKLYDLEPTGNRIHYNGAAFFTLEDGKFSRIRVLGDRYTLYTQLGLKAGEDKAANIPQE